MKIKLEAEGRVVEADVDDEFVAVVQRQAGRQKAIDFICAEITAKAEGLIQEVYRG